MVRNCILSLLCALPIPAVAGRVTPIAHPNHYLFLVDSSGSSRWDAPTTKNLNDALRVAVDRAYADGFGVIPKLDPAQDVVTVHHFGLVPDGQPGIAYQRIHEFPLPENFIHVLAARERGLAAERVHALLYPRERYRLTFFELAESCALARLASATPAAETANRTFLIFIRDHELAGQPLEMIHDGAPEQYDQVMKVWAGVRRDYTFSIPPLWTQNFGVDSGGKITIDVKEIKSNAIETWTADIAKVEGIGDHSFDWSGANAGVLSLDYTNELQSTVLRDAPAASLRVNGVDVPAAAGPHIRLSVPGCEPMPANVELTATPVRVDPTLGRVVLQFNTTQSYQVPVPTRCGLLFRILMYVLIAIALLLLLAAIYWIRYTRYLTHIVVSKPVGLRVWPLRWDRPDGIPEAVPASETEVLRLKLPSRALRSTVYRNARLVLSSEPPNQFQWNDSDAESMAISAAGAEAVVRRRGGEAKTARLTVFVEKNKRTAVFHNTPDAEV